MDLNFILLIRAIGNEEERLEHRIIKRQLRDHSNPLTLPEVIFKQIYRLCRTTAHYLVQEISPFLQEKEREEIAIPDTLIVLCALHFYGQGSYQKSVGQDMNMPMCQASVSKSVDAVTSILNEHFGHIIQFPISEEEKDIEKRKFMNMVNGFPASKIINACGIIYNIRLSRHDFEEVEETNDDIENQNNEPPNPEWQNGPLNQEWRNEGSRVRQRIVNTYF
ncbi:hypothetical protein NQ314_011139 [Rhamnusium bicolor]|uniref:Nuclease HARBI1 n=1 Tax=Rhamnusium bicolor TaxID=1586634 RepID=A0AAV8XMX3_9CUCU|nr:hypothetical protein NQ314_011139 [Rhamnusium bicolor]